MCSKYPAGYRAVRLASDVVESPHAWSQRANGLVPLRGHPTTKIGPSRHPKVNAPKSVFLEERYQNPRAVRAAVRD